MGRVPAAPMWAVVILASMELASRAALSLGIERCCGWRFCSSCSCCRECDGANRDWSVPDELISLELSAAEFIAVNLDDSEIYKDE